MGSRNKLYLAMLLGSQVLVGGATLAAPQGGEIVGGVGTNTHDALDTRI